MKDGEKGKQSKKTQKGAKSSPSKSKMYAMDSIYDESVQIDPSKVSKMYAMNNVYGDQLVIETPAVQEMKNAAAPKLKKEATTNSKPVKEAEGMLF